MLDWSTKTLVRKYYYSNINDDRECTKSVRINGRLYDKHGVDCATTLVALVYKVFDPSVKHNKTIVLVGIARQNPGDTVLDLDYGIEVATENAMIDPVMKVEYNDDINDNVVYCLLKSYILGLPVKFVKTKQELQEEGKDLNMFDRKKTENYYNNYYNDFKKLFL